MIDFNHTVEVMCFVFGQVKLQFLPLKLLHMLQKTIAVVVLIYFAHHTPTQTCCVDIIGNAWK